MASRTALLLEALGHPHALAVVVQLLERGPQSESELCEETKLNQPTASKLLQKLGRAGVVKRPSLRARFELVDAAAMRELFVAANSVATAAAAAELAEEEDLQLRLGQPLRKDLAQGVAHLRPAKEPKAQP